MKVNSYTNVTIQKYLLFVCILQVNGSFLSRLKNRYEYLPHTTKDFTIEDMNYIQDELSPETNFPATISNELYRRTLGDDYIANTLVNEPVTQTFTEAVSKITQGPSSRKRTFNKSEATFYNYNRDNWTTIKPFAPTRLIRFEYKVSAMTKKRKRTWPSHFPPKFISKLQGELDDALLPWKTTKIDGTNVSTTKIKQNIQSSCYMCGLDQKGIPRTARCHYAFESNDFQYRKTLRSFKVKCIKDSSTRRIRNKHYGPTYVGGCFKRFLDVGVEYSERGCRTKPPMKGISYASHRLASLEKMLTDIDDGCVFSPFASLTPFSRAVSLFVRYHVCVCKGKYCNRASNLFQLKHYKILFLAFYCTINL